MQNPVVESRHFYFSADAHLATDLRGFTVLQLELVLCGRCPKLHGPYWYAYRSKNGRTTKKYIGKKLPAELREWSKPS